MSKREIDCDDVEAGPDTKKQQLEVPLFPILAGLPSVFQVATPAIR